MKEAVIVSTARTGLAKSWKGALNLSHGATVGGHVVRHAVERAGIDPAEVEDVVMGCATPEGATGSNIARQIAIRAGLPASVPGATVNRFCASGLQAIAQTAQRIVAGEGEVFVAGGVECISTVQGTINQHMLEDAWLKRHVPAIYMPMLQTAEIVAKRYGIDRERQDRYGTESQLRAAAAQTAGRFDDEIVPVSIPQKKGDPVVFAKDEFINRKTSLDVLGGLRPAFDKAGSVTAGNASGINDGAAAVMLMSAAKAEALGLKPMARIASYASAGLDPAFMGMGPVPAARRALERAGWSAADLDLLEINEAFAAQACAVHQEMGWDLSKVNVNGGAIAIGHPIGASGCRILVTLLHEMQRRDAKKGIASLCIGGGMGVALTVER